MLDGYVVDIVCLRKFGQAQLLDRAATPQVVTTLRQSTTRAGARLRARRHRADGEMHTTDVTEI